MQRQYTGTAGRIENGQVAVYLTYAAARGHAMIDRELYLPKSWIDDPEHCAAAGVPEDIDFLTKPALATGMLLCALNAAVPARWVAGDEVYGADPTHRRQRHTREFCHLLPRSTLRTPQHDPRPCRDYRRNILAANHRPQLSSLIITQVHSAIVCPAPIIIKE